MMNEPIAGKYLLEILTRGMYSNAMHIYREYIQNSVDSIDKAIQANILNPSEAEIHITIDEESRTIVIRDNGMGMPLDIAESTLMSIGHSDKDGITERGFVESDDWLALNMLLLHNLLLLLGAKRKRRS